MRVTIKPEAKEEVVDDLIRKARVAKLKKAAQERREQRNVRRLRKHLRQPQFAVGDAVLFADERGTQRRSHVTRIVPVGEYSATELGYAIRGDYGSYVRVAGEIQRDIEGDAP